ncbi:MULTISPECIES: methylated-DNA--[protein]-cysteine S-methyltransferase [unclassified Streptomyces]|uniref:methylated-DNA--[protein]-cysteine S-methyltransferase n=1 Tax=unclassified Streptomyces TaxID=2593676 RepID=UPI0015870FF8|nr:MULTISPECIES: methylated-DNA--[protein]-cysteine S-methyltransferase [unclassified Streptomyces]NUV66845.1 methylated-DNA--[protein]-cysteine S-methyltransferase [Streptomyces sp. CAI-121]NUW01543.1 methylated-DNA--[protein]-cysteine S-methyltransferase [Streptomyces sp. CAI 127]NUW18482.1 methylated-DNA--[protein]-cysteine S-methyltransferase [Streptomyces sp. CAI-68]
MTTTVYARVESPLGELLLVGEESAADGPDTAGAGGAAGGVRLRSLSVPGQKGGAVVEDGWRYAPEAFTEVGRQLEAYFAGRSTRFDVPVAEGLGTEFQRRVWAVLESIPYGSTVSYGEVAAQVGASGAGVRAVGTAIGRNPLLVVRPCHRVIGADGALRGYAGGLERKKLLLGLEGGAERSEP